MKLKPRLFGGAKIDNLHKQSLELSQAMGKQPTPAELTQLEKVLEELCELGYWPAHQSLANLYGKRIWVTVGQSDVETLPQEQRSEIMNYATLGLLHLGIFCEKEGKKIDPDTLNNVQRYQQEFKRYAQLVKPA